MPSENIEGVLGHKKVVSKYMQVVASDLFGRAIVHDYSKFSPEEFDVFEEVTPLLKSLEYGSEEYRIVLHQLKPALNHHYAVNSHHPEHYPNGINDMTLIDLIEMVCDWMAAVQRMKDGDINKSLEINKERFMIDDQLFAIIKNTVVRIDQFYGQVDIDLPLVEDGGDW